MIHYTLAVQVNPFTENRTRYSPGEHIRQFVNRQVIPQGNWLLAVSFEKCLLGAPEHTGTIRAFVDACDLQRFQYPGNYLQHTEARTFNVDADRQPRVYGCRHQRKGIGQGKLHALLSNNPRLTVHIFLKTLIWNPKAYQHIPDQESAGKPLGLFSGVRDFGRNCFS